MEEKLIVNLVDFRQQTAQQVLCKLLDRFEDVYDGYQQRPEELQDMPIEKYTANIAVTYADALIESLGIIPDADPDSEETE